MKIIRCGEKTGTYDETNFTFNIKGKSISFPRNLVLESGDSVRIEGEIWEIMDFNPSLFPAIADRRAQIIQPHDAAYLISRSGIGIGSSVVESGVGSGALTSYVLWNIGNKGKLISIDHDAERINAARASLGRFFDLDNWETVVGRIEDDSGLRGIDACLLDVPAPWEALSTVRKYLRKGGILAVYCPNFNQSERTVVDGMKTGFSALETVELELRRIIVRDGSTRPDNNGLMHTGFMTFLVKRGNSSIDL